VGGIVGGKTGGGGGRRWGFETTGVFVCQLTELTTDSVSCSDSILSVKPDSNRSLTPPLGSLTLYRILMSWYLMCTL
jgi:hypothetical protein